MRAQGVAPASIRGSGPGGRIVEADVMVAAESGDSRRAGVGHVSNVPLPTSTLETCSTFWLQATADVTSLLEIQRQIAEEVQRKCGTPLRLADFILRAIALALVDCPQANCAWQGETCVALPSANVGFEVNLPGARLVPIIPRADRFRLLELISRRAELTAAAQAGRLQPDAAEQAATALSDLSDFRIEQYAAILLPPRTSVLAVGRPTATSAFVENRSAVRQSLCLTLTVDERALAPETAASFLSRIVQLLEHPFLLLCERLTR
jgi:pyruvate dehydrogenase E2 component (dihydrolipoamide acetyltransferase)